MSILYENSLIVSPSFRKSPRFNRQIYYNILYYCTIYRAMYNFYFSVQLLEALRGKQFCINNTVQETKNDDFCVRGNVTLCFEYRCSIFSSSVP